MDDLTQDAPTTAPPGELLGVARRLLVHEGAAGQEPGASPQGQDVAAAERVLQRLQQQLVRWFGPDGADALLTRALDRVRSSHPILTVVQCDALVGARLTGVAEAAAAVGPETLTDAFAALISTVLALVGRLVGNDLAAHLVEQGWPDLPRGESGSNERVGE